MGNTDKSVFRGWSPDGKSHAMLDGTGIFEDPIGAEHCDEHVRGAAENPALCMPRETTRPLQIE